MVRSIYDVIGIGNAIVDVISAEPDTRIVELGLNKGAMTIVDKDQAERIYDQMVKPAFIFDGRNHLEHEKLFEIGFNVFPLGRPPLKHIQ